MAERNLLILHWPGLSTRSDWDTIARRVAQRAPDIEVRIAEGEESSPEIASWQESRPSLVFSHRNLAASGYVPPSGKVYAGRDDIDKTNEMERLEASGISVPRTTVLTPNLLLPPAEWGEYVIVKPSRGAGGRGIRVVRRVDLARRWTELSDMNQTMLVQRFIEHLDGKGRPTTYRILVMFGRTLYAMKSCWKESRGPLDWLASSPAHAVAANAANERHRSLIFDHEMIAYAERAASAFPEIPVLAVDLMKETGTGRLYVSEVNARGGSWNLSSGAAMQRYTRAFRNNLYRQFNALDTAADLLIERTRAEAI